VARALFTAVLGVVLRRLLGEAVQVDPIKPTLKAPGTKRLKLEYYKLLSSFAFKFNLRRYSWGGGASSTARWSPCPTSSTATGSPPWGRGLQKSTFQLNVSAFCGIGGVLRGCVGGVQGM